MIYLLDSNILRYYAAAQTTLLRNLIRIPSQEIGVPLVVVIEQLRGRFDAFLKAEPENLLREQERLRATQNLVSVYQTVYVDDQTIKEIQRIQQRVSTKKRYADVVI